MDDGGFAVNGCLPAIGVMVWFVAVVVAYIRFRKKDTAVALSDEARNALGLIYWVIIGGFLICMVLVYIGERLP